MVVLLKKSCLEGVNVASVSLKVGWGREVFCASAQSQCCA